MSSYSTQLRTLVERYSQYEQGLSINEKIEIGRKYLFNFSYPFFDEEYRPIFERNFIRTFYTREIGFEVEELFKLNLDNWLNVNMPFYNKLFMTERIEFNPFDNVDLTEKYTLNKQGEQKGNVKGTSSSDTNGSTKGSNTGSATTTNKGEQSNVGFSRELGTDTPQDRLAITTKDGAGVIEYASNISEDKNTNDGKSSSTGTNKTTSSNTISNTYKNTGKTTADSETTMNTVDDYIRTLKGKQGDKSISSMLKEYRDTLIRTEQMIFKEMNQLFMLVY